MIDILVRFTASFLIWAMYLGILVLWIIDGRIKKEQAIHVLLASFLAWIVSSIIKDLFPIPRPFVINGGDVMVFIPTIDGAFPSAHTAMAFSIAVTMWLHDRKWGFVYLIAAALIGIARVIGNVHYPLDILGGAILGIIIGLLVEKIHLNVFSPPRANLKK